MKRGYADSPYGQVHYVTAGSGTPVVLIGPSKRSSRVHAELIALLAKQYLVLAPDTLGFGNSDPLPAGATFDMLAEGVLSCLDAIGQRRAHFYGLHTGNKIAAAIASRWPERVGKLVLAGQSHSIIPDQKRRNAVIGDLVKDLLDESPVTDEARRQLKAWAALYRRVTEIWWDDAIFGDGVTPERLALAKRIVLDNIQSSDSTTGLYQANFSYDLEAAMRSIKAPTLILEIATPAEDQEYGRQGAIVQKLIPGSTLTTLHEAGGHAHTLEGRATELAKILTGFFG